MSEPTEIPGHLKPLATLYPHYSQAELAEAYENLRRYIEMGWAIATRLEHEGRLPAILTHAGFNPTVKPQIDHSYPQPL